MPGRVRRMGLGVVLAACVLAGCARYPQDTPEAVIASARKMVRDGRADRLQRLIYADNRDMRRVLERVGILFGHLQDLATVINEKFPDEVAAMRRQAEEAAARGEATSLLGSALSDIGVGRSRRSGPRRSPEQMRASLDRLIQEVYADPYGWLERSGDRLSTTLITDDMAALLWDGQPILPPIGIVLREDKGKWYLALPTNLPGISSAMPRNAGEYDVWIKLVTVLDKVVLDLTHDVRAGKAKDLRSVSEAAGEKAFFPMALGVLAYTKMVEAREKEAAPAR